MHELLAAAVPAAAGAWAGGHAWMLRRARARASLGQEGAPFTLPGTDGRRHSRADLDAAAVVLLFMSNRCPGVKAYDARLRRLMERHPEAAFVGVNPIDGGHYPGESMARMREAQRDRGLGGLLYLKDADQEVARAYGAVCTPEVVVLDARRRIAYRGRIDDSLVERNVRRHYLEDALVALRKGRPPRIAETAPLGCSIDAVAGNAIVRAAGG
jgi:peroxiredoxin